MEWYMWIIMVASVLNLLATIMLYADQQEYRSRVSEHVEMIYKGLLKLYKSLTTQQKKKEE